jgi:hypothetical protein
MSFCFNQGVSYYALRMRHYNTDGIVSMTKSGRQRGDLKDM